MRRVASIRLPRIVIAVRGLVFPGKRTRILRTLLLRTRRFVEGQSREMRFPSWWKWNARSSCERRGRFKAYSFGESGYHGMARRNMERVSESITMGYILLIQVGATIQSFKSAAAEVHRFNASQWPGGGKFPARWAMFWPPSQIYSMLPPLQCDRTDWIIGGKIGCKIWRINTSQFRLFPQRKQNSQSANFRLSG
jgi:hypothetical protein